MRDNLDEVATMDLIDMYASAADAHDQAGNTGDSVAANRNAQIISDVYKTLCKRGEGELKSLLPLMKDSRVGVRLWAAAHMLEFEPKTAEQTLLDIQNGSEHGPRKVSARMTLQEWKAGRLKFERI